MFKDCSIMVLAAGVEEECEIYNLDINSDTQKEICKTFKNLVEQLTENKSKVIFNGSYKPNEDEFLTIENFQLSDAIKDAIRNPLEIQKDGKINDEFPEIKAVFIGSRTEKNKSEKFNIAFQRFRKEQYLSLKGYNLFFDKETFFQEKRFGISISDNIDCYYTEGELQFISFFFARQVFDLSEYYRSATDQEVRSFSTNEKLLLSDTENFQNMANSWIRRKIALINDSNVLKQYSSEKIKKLAKSVGIDISVENQKIVIPNDKEQIKIILGFLDEEAYKGPFSHSTYLANSKRQIKKNAK